MAGKRITHGVAATSVVTTALTSNNVQVVSVTNYGTATLFAVAGGSNHVPADPAAAGDDVTAIPAGASVLIPTNISYDPGLQGSGGETVVVKTISGTAGGGYCISAA